MRWEREVPLAPLVRYRIGGPADRLGRPSELEELRDALRSLEASDHLVLGTGANILVSEEGVQRPVLVLGKAFEELRVEPDAIVAGAGARLPALAGEARRAGRLGFHFLEAVPGTVGGGLRMNAGSRDEGLWDRVAWAEAVTPEGDVERLVRGDAEPLYRATSVPESWVFVRARLTALPGDTEEVREAHLSFRTRKVRDQVYDLPSVGSTWKNPAAPHPPAWKIVENVGMRGARVGGAQVAERHANFIVNLGEARADDVLALMAETRRRAHERFGIRLQPEIRFWGFAPDRLADVGAA